MGSALTNPRTPAQNDQSSRVKNESNFIKIGSLVATSQQLHKQPLKKTALQVSEFNPCENQPALWVWSYKPPHLPSTSLIVSPFSEASPHSTEIIFSLFYEKAYPTTILKSVVIERFLTRAAAMVWIKNSLLIFQWSQISQRIWKKTEHTHKNKQTHTQRDTHTENRPYVNLIDHNSCCFHSIL